MPGWIRYALAIVIGAIIGTTGAAFAVRAGALGSNEQIGPWATGRDFGTAQAGPYTRAVVALYGLLALPASEARYYTAATDDAGAPLSGNCRYRVSGGAMPTRWWSLTVYDQAGYLVPNAQDIYSVASLNLPAAEQGQWSVIVAPTQQPGHWLPTGKADHFALTLRTYLPADAGRTNLTREQLPRIVKEGC